MNGSNSGTPRMLLVGVPFLLAAVIVALLGCAPATGDLGTVATPPAESGSAIDTPTAEPTPAVSEPPAFEPGTSGPSKAPSPASSPAPSPVGTTTVRAYFFLGSFTDNAGLAPVLREVPKTGGIGAAAMAALLKGPNARELSGRPAMYTSVPAGTRFLGLRIENAIATVDLSREFEAGGGMQSVRGRLAQVVYTLTQFPTVHDVRFELDGEPATTFGGVSLDRAFDRADFADALPAIFVDRPAWGGVLGNPGRVTGLANVFEATFRVAVLDGAGRVLTDQRAMALCGTGCWGTFDVTVSYSVPTAGWGTLRVYDLSAKDGSRENVTDYRVWLMPHN
jgi:germination protein M